MTLDVVVSGASGRMGRALAELVREAGDLRLAGGIAREGRTAEQAAALGYERIAVADEARPLIESAEAVVDFSAPEQLEALLAAQREALAGRALVVGTTGLGAGLDEKLDAAAERSPVLAAANFSIGVNLLLALVEQAAARLAADRYDVEIVEAHHRHKADAPSGTALALGRAVAGARGARLDEIRRDGRSGRTGERGAGEIAFHALRGGEVTGEHRVTFLAARERLELAHGAADRSLFAEGALEAVRWSAGRPPGRYDMRDVLGL